MFVLPVVYTTGDMSTSGGTDDPPTKKMATTRWKKAGNIGRLIGKIQTKKTEQVEEEQFVPEAKRRFLFDDTALRKGGSMKDAFQADEPPIEDFNDIVDQDDQRVTTFISKELVGELIESFHFRLFIFGLIIVNSMLIGLQTDENLSVDYRFLFSIFDQVVMATFICEILLKWYYGFWIFWKVGWNILDFIIIAALILGPQLTFLSSSRILRILRVMRAFRSLKSISALAGLSLVVQTILQSVPDMANICLLLCIILLVFGVSGVTFFGQEMPDRFGDLQTTMYSLFICVTQDGWVQIFEKFREKSTSLHVGGAIYFFFSIMVGAFVFANLVVAVVVTNLEMALKELKAENQAEVDTLATTKQAEHEDFGFVEDTTDVNIKSYKDILRKVDYTSQTPLQIVNLRGLTCEKLENYFILLTALEENLCEYQEIQHDLKMVYEMTKSLNKYMETEDDDDPSNDDGNMGHNKPRGSFINLADLKKGDIMSNMMELEARSNLNSRDKTSIDAVIRSVRESTAPFNLIEKFKKRRRSSTTATPSK